MKVDCVEGDPAGYIVEVTINGLTGEPKPLEEGNAVDSDGNIWQVKADVPVTFDAQQGQEVKVEVKVLLPEGGETEWDETARLGNPEIRFNSSIKTVGGVGPVASFFSQVESEFKLSLSDDLERLKGKDDLRYLEFDVGVSGTPCTIQNTSATDGILEVVNADFTVSNDGKAVLPEQLVLFIPNNGLSASYTVTCDGSNTFPSYHYFESFVALHGAAVCGGEYEIDQSAGGISVKNWAVGSGQVWAKKEYDRSCTVDEVTFTEKTTIELLDPGAGD